MRPIQLLFFSSIAGGLATPLTLILMLLIAHDQPVMGANRIGKGLFVAGGAVAAIITAATLPCLIEAIRRL